MPALPAPALDRLTKLCGLLTSEHDGERATAARMASDLLRQHRLTWAEVLKPDRAPVRPCPACAARRAPRGAAAGSWRKTLASLAELAVRRPSLFTTWERAFICNLLDRRTISERQREILAWRQEGINARMGLRFGELEPMGLELRGRLGLENVLVRMRDGSCEPTPTFEALANYCVARRIKIIWLDHILHIVAGDITRAEEVSKMLAMLGGLAQRIDGAVAIAGHVAKAEGSQFLGSVMFSALVRSRLWLRRPTAEEIQLQPAADPKNLRVLELAKANHAGLTQMTLEWRDGVLGWLGDAGAQEAQRERERHAEAVFIRALRELDRRERSVSTQGPTSATRIITDYGLDEGCSTEELQGAMRRLIHAKRIKAGVTKPWLKGNRMPAKGLALSEDTP